MRKLTEREKWLVYAAFLLALLAGSYFFLKMPADNTRNETRANLTALKIELEQQKAEIEKLPELQRELVRLQTDSENVKYQIPLYENSNVPMIEEVTGIFNTCGLNIEWIDIISLKENSDKVQSDSDLVHVGKTGRGSSDEEGKRPEPDESKPWKTLTALIEVKADGTKEHLCALLDQFETKPWISVTSFDTAENGGLSMTISYTMLELNSDETGR